MEQSFQIRKKLLIFFCDYFSNIAADLEQSLPTNNIDPMSFMQTSLPNSFYLNPVDVEEVTKLIKNIKNSKQY